MIIIEYNFGHNVTSLESTHQPQAIRHGRLGCCQRDREQGAVYFSNSTALLSVYLEIQIHAYSVCIHVIYCTGFDPGSGINVTRYIDVLIASPSEL